MFFFKKPILNGITIIFFSLLSATICRKMGIVADFPLSLIGVAIVFPITFSINAAFQRKEKALTSFANIKAHTNAILLSTVHWHNKNFFNLFNQKIYDLIKNMQLFFEHKYKKEDEKPVYQSFSAISVCINQLREYLSATDVSRLNQYLSKVLINFEILRTISEYRSSYYLTNYGKVVTLVFPILYGPYFGHHISGYSPTWLGYFLPVLYSIVVFILQHIQNSLENAVDGIGRDDLKINVAKYIEETNYLKGNNKK